MSDAFAENIDYSLDDKRVNICNLTPAEVDLVCLGLYLLSKVQENALVDQAAQAEELLKIIKTAKDLAQDA